MEPQPDFIQHITGTGNAAAQDGGIATAYNVTLAWAALPPPSLEELAAAEQLLATLPLDRVPSLAPFPANSRMSLKHNPLFVGREDDFKALAVSLMEGGTTALGQVAAASGFGGVGKTQLAIEFVHRYGQYFAGGVFWLDFSTPSLLPVEVASCIQLLGFPPALSGLPVDERVSLVTNTWQSPLPRLLVFDNCEDPQLLADQQPSTGGCRILLTSRYQYWDDALGVQVHHLDVLSRPESIEYLRLHRSDLAAENPVLDAIAQELGDLPLALYLAGSYLKSYGDDISPESYLEQLQTTNPLEHTSMEGKGTMYSPTKHELNVWKTFAVGYDRLDPDDSIDVVARAILARAGYFAPGEPIPRDVLLATLESSNEESDLSTDASDALRRLVDLGFLTDLRQEGDEPSKRMLQMHRLVSAFVQEVGADAEAEGAVELVLANTINQLNDAGYPEPVLALQPHLRHLIKRSPKRIDEWMAFFCGALGHHLEMIGDYHRAQSLLERAFAIHQQLLGPLHPDTAGSLNNLASVLQSRGWSDKAQPLYERALVIREEVLGPEHPNTASSVSNLANLLERQGKYSEAQPLHERALEIRERVLGPEHPDTAVSLNNLAGLLVDQRKYVDALPLHERALAIRERVLGPEHPNTATSLNNLADLLVHQRNYTEAEVLCMRAVAIRERVLGPEHPDTATSLNNLAIILMRQGKATEAQLLCERVLAIREKVLGAEHLDTAVSFNNLAYFFQSQGNAAEAKTLYERALAIWEQALGPEHSHTASALYNLASVNESQGRATEAQALYERALAIWEQVLGPEHPDTASARDGLARVLESQGNYTEAQALYEQTLEIWEQVLGSEHLNTATSLNNLASVLENQGKATEAQPLYERALTIREQALGPEHPDTASSLNNLASVLEKQGKYDEAQPLLERALTICEEVLGPEHPQTLTTRTNLSVTLSKGNKHPLGQVWSWLKKLTRGDRLSA
jgi:tetratricopeptide (TPR) repeat protein